jgi:hypothetical protein
MKRASLLLNWLKMVFIRFSGFGDSFGLRIVPEFLAATSLLEPAKVCRTELKPFLTIFGTAMRAKKGLYLTTVEVTSLKKAK